jgi:lipopolysaccharide export system permease protein
MAPWASRSFRTIYEKIVKSEPLINVEPKKFFAIKNIKIYAEKIDRTTNHLENIFVYQSNNMDPRPADRIFAKRGEIAYEGNQLQLALEEGQMQKFDPAVPANLIHTVFGSYRFNLAIRQEGAEETTRFRNLSSSELKRMIHEFKEQKTPSAPLEAELNLRQAIAFAPLALILVGMPLATVLKRGGRGFSFGISIVVIFVYYTFLVLGLTLAEKGKLPPTPALWIANALCFVTSLELIRRLTRQ